MARLTDPEKLERIKRATMELIIQNGYQGVTTAKIADMAKVSSGYLYHHYESKDQLVCSFLEKVYNEIRDAIGELIDESSTFQEIVSHMYRSILHVVNRDSVQAEFMYVLSHDPHFHRIALKSSLSDISNGMGLLREHLLTKGYIRTDIDRWDLMVFLLEVPVSYMYHRIKDATDRVNITEEEVLRVAEKAVKALQ